VWGLFLVGVWQKKGRGTGSTSGIPHSENFEMDYLSIYSNILHKMYELWLESSYVTSLIDYENDVLNKKKVIYYYHTWYDITNLQFESLDLANNKVKLDGIHLGIRQKVVNNVPQYFTDRFGEKRPVLEFYSTDTYNFNEHPFELVELRAMDDAFDIEGIKIKKGDSRWLPAVMVYDLMDKQTQTVYSQTAWFALELVGYWFGISEVYRGVQMTKNAIKLGKIAETAVEQTISKQLTIKALKTSAVGLIDLGMILPGTYINFLADQTWIEQHEKFVNAYRAVSFAYFTGRILYSLAKVNNLKQEADDLAKDGITADEKAFGQEISNFCRGTSCFTPNTAITYFDNTQHPIKAVKIGDWLLSNTKVTTGKAATIAENGKVSYLALDSEVNPDPYTSADQKALDKLDYSSIETQTVTLLMKKSPSGDLGAGNGSVSEIQLLRPTTWLEHHGIAQKGKSTYLHLPEMGLEGFATVTNLAHFRVTKSDTASEDEAWSGGLVTGVFKHIANGVYHLRYSNGDTLGVTGTHPLYSLDRQGFVPVEDIKEGEHLLSKAGIITVVAKTYDPTPQAVYNLEVGQWHNFLVGQSAVVVHNTGCRLLLADEVVDLGSGRVFNHFTNDIAVSGITGVPIGMLEELAIGERILVNDLKFAKGSATTLAVKEGEIFVTELGVTTSSGKLNQIGVFGDKQNYVISFSEEIAFLQNAKVSARSVERSIYAIPPFSILNGNFIITRVR
jgi:hypothetical protein